MGSRMTPPSERDLVAHAVRELARRTGFPVAFGGMIVGGDVVITSVHGARTRGLDGLRVEPNLGLGGRAIAERRPRMTHDYGSSSTITHDYDAAVLGEGISTLLAVPVIVDGEPRAVLYGGAGRNQSVSEVVAAPAFQVAESLAAELRVRAEVERRVALIAHTAPIAVATPQLSGGAEERLRAAFAEVRAIAADITDAGLRRRLVDVQRALSSVTGGPPSAAAEDVKLSPREIDVLSCAALGGTTADIARQLGLQPGTVKAYLGTAMSKLGANTRAAAVAQARLAGILP